MGVWKGRQGGGGAVDTEARALASALTEKLGNIYKTAGDSVKGGDEVFVVLADGSIVNFANYGKKPLIIPVNPDKDNMLAVGFSVLASDNSAIIQTLLTERTAWTVDSLVDFTQAEPALIAANAGKIYLSTVTGKGSVSNTLTFDKDDLYVVSQDLSWHEYVPKDGWTLTHEDRAWQYYNSQWNLKPGVIHNHDRLTDGTTTYIVRNGTLNIMKVT